MCSGVSSAMYLYSRRASPQSFAATTTLSASFSRPFVNWVTFRVMGVLMGFGKFASWNAARNRPCHSSATAFRFDQCTPAYHWFKLGGDPFKIIWYISSNSSGLKARASTTVEVIKLSARSSQRTWLLLFFFIKIYLESVGNLKGGFHRPKIIKN